MAIIGYFLIAIAEVFRVILNLYMWIIIIRALISWVNPDPYNQVVRVIYNLTDPVLNRIRRRLPVVYGGMDFSPIIVLLVIVFLENFLVGSLFAMGIRLKGGL